MFDYKESKMHTKGCVTDDFMRKDKHSVLVAHA